MAIELTVETGAGLADANVYISLEAADAFHEANVNAGAWATKTTAEKMAALITATRMLDQQWIWNGFKKTETQSLQWPRLWAPDADRAANRQYLPDDEVPPAIVRATAMYATALFSASFEAQPQGQGISSFSLDGVMSVSFDPSTVMGLVPDWITAELSKYGSLALAKSRFVRVVRT